MTSQIESLDDDCDCDSFIHSRLSPVVYSLSIINFSSTLQYLCVSICNAFLAFLIYFFPISFLFNSANWVVIGARWWRMFIIHRARASRSRLQRKTFTESKHKHREWKRRKMFIQARGLTDDRVFFLFKFPQRQPHFSRWFSCSLQILFKVSCRGWWPSRCEKSRLYSLCCLSLALNVKLVGGASFDFFSLLYFLFRFVASTKMTRGSLSLLLLC